MSRGLEVVLGRGRPSIAPERLFRSLLLQIFYSVRSERMLIEQLQYNLLFVGLWGWRWTRGVESRGVQQESGAIAERRDRGVVFRRVLERARPFMSDEHFTVDGTLIEAWASQKSFRPKDGRGSRQDRRRGGLSRGEAKEPNP